MKSFSEYLQERTAELAASIYARTQRRYGYGKMDPRKYFGGIGTDRALGTKPSIKEVASSLALRSKHYPDNPKDRPPHTEKTVAVKNIVTTQTNINGAAIKKYIKYYSDNPEEAKKSSIETFPHKDKDKVFVGDGHHRLAALKLLGHKTINVKYFERVK